MKKLLLFLLLQGVCCDLASSSEIRLGLLRHDVKSSLKQTDEKGTDLSAQCLFENLGGASAPFFYPYPHVGLSFNTQGATHQVYAGLTWQIPLGLVFLEASFGGEVHDGPLKVRTPTQKALGSRFLFRESLAIGVNIFKNLTVSCLIDHSSNARLCQPNPGLTNFGFQIGYKF